MKNILTFNVPFGGFESTDFINCFTSVYLYLEKIPIIGDPNFKCAKKEGKQCNSCGNCGTSPYAFQEKYFHLFDTMCGRSSLRCRFDKKPTEMQKLIGETEEDSNGTDYTVEFLYGFAGYEYHKLTDPSSFKNKIYASIDLGKPVIAKVKTRQVKNQGLFRVITGYDNDLLISPDYTNAQQKPETIPDYGDICALYITGEKITPRYTLTDGLKRIEKVMEYNISQKLWDGYTEKIGWYGWESGNGMQKAGIDEKKARMKRVAETMWHTFNSHNTAEVFRHRIYEELKNPAFNEICKKIGGACFGYTHDLAAGLIGLNAQLDWTNNWHGCGFAEIVQLVLYQIKKNDDEVLAAVKEMIGILKSR